MPQARRIWNPPNPYLSEHREWRGEPPPGELEVYEDDSQSILSRNGSPDLKLRWCVNPYRGCLHVCAYGDARPTHEYFGFGSATNCQRRIFVKPKAPALLEQAFRRNSWAGDPVIFSDVTDCCQPVEAAWGLTQRCLNVCVRFRNPRRDHHQLTADPPLTSICSSGRPGTWARRQRLRCYSGCRAASGPSSSTGSGASGLASGDRRPKLEPYR